MLLTDSIYELQIIPHNLCLIIRNRASNGYLHRNWTDYALYYKLQIYLISNLQFSFWYKWYSKQIHWCLQLMISWILNWSTSQHTLPRLFRTFIIRHPVKGWFSKGQVLQKYRKTYVKSFWTSIRLKNTCLQFQVNVPL